MSRTINLASAIRGLSSRRVADYDGLYFAIVDKMEELSIAPVRKPPVRPKGDAGSINVRGMLEFVADCGRPNGEMAKEAAVDLLRSEAKSLQAMRAVLEQRHAITGYVPKREEERDTPALLA